VLQAPASAAKLRRLCELTPFARAEFDRARKPSRDPVERARRLIVRAYMGIGSGGAQGKPTGFRFSATRDGTTPAMDWSRWPAQIPRYVERLATVVIECQPALEMLADHDGKDTLYYVDPPYLESVRRRGTRRRYRHEMSENDHTALAAALRGLSGRVVVSGYDSPMYDELYQGWETDRTVSVADNGCHGTSSIHSARRTEVVWLNPACSAALARARSQLSLLDAAPLAP
jgi:DNA adenine methylase